MPQASEGFAQGHCQLPRHTLLAPGLYQPVEKWADHQLGAKMPRHPAGSQGPLRPDSPAGRYTRPASFLVDPATGQGGALNKNKERDLQ